MVLARYFIQLAINSNYIDLNKLQNIATLTNFVLTKQQGAN